MISLSQYTSQIIAVLERAGTLVLDLQKKNLTVTNKTGIQDVVTEGDLSCQAFIKKEISRIFKDTVGFIGEENLHNKKDITFVLDPIDGTANYASNNPFFAISLACFVGNEVQAGFIHIPQGSKTYYAIKDQGTRKKYKDEISILHMKNASLSQSLLTINTSLIRKTELYNKYSIHALAASIRGIRLFGSIAAEICQCTDNELQGIIHSKVKLWDIAAGYVLIKEAGGEMRNFDGTEIHLSLDKDDINEAYKVIISANDNIHHISRILTSK